MGLEVGRPVDDPRELHDLGPNLIEDFSMSFIRKNHWYFGTGFIVMDSVNSTLFHVQIANMSQFSQYR